MPSSYNHPPQESLVQHFSTAHIDDLEERSNQLMVARRAHTQPPHIHAPHQSCEYCYHHSHGFDDCPFYTHYVTEANKSSHELVQTTTTTLVIGERANNHEKEEEEMEERIELPPNPSIDKEVSTEAYSFVTIPLETYHKPPISPFQCLEELSYVEIFKETHTEDHKSKNRVPKWILRNTINYIRWWNILLEGYQILKKK